MTIIPRITFRNSATSEAVEARIGKHVERLVERDQRIQDCHVTVEAPHQHKGGLFRVGIHVNTPGAELVVSHEGPHNPAHADVYVAIKDAFEAAERQVRERLRRQSDAHRVARPEPAADES